MNKTFCDVCQKQLELSDSWKIHISPNKIGMLNLVYREVCEECINKIKIVMVSK